MKSPHLSKPLEECGDHARLRPEDVLSRVLHHLGTADRPLLILQEQGAGHGGLFFRVLSSVRGVAGPGDSQSICRGLNPGVRAGRGRSKLGLFNGEIHWSFSPSPLLFRPRFFAFRFSRQRRRRRRETAFTKFIATELPD